MFYLLKLSVSICLVYLFYRMLLRRLTFYTWNRWYLAAYLVVAFFIPLINISSLVENSYVEASPVISYIPVIENYSGGSKALTPIAVPHGMTAAGILMLLIAAGSLMMIVRLIFQYRSLQKIKRGATILSSGEAVIYHVEQPVIPFSFGAGIYVNRNQHSEKELEEIILHEYVHVRQKHTIDILLAELLCVVNWYNPFAWLTRHAIRQNLEFIADNEVLKKGLDKKAYQYHLLRVVGTPQYKIAVNFNLSSLKKRIAMMNTLKSARPHLLRFLFIMPMIAVLLLAFRNRITSLGQLPAFCSEAGMVIDASTNRPVADVLVSEANSGLSAVTDKKGFFTLRIPLHKDSFNCNFKLTKGGYQQQETNFRKPGRYAGFIHVLGFFANTDTGNRKADFFMPGSQPFDGKPSYADVLKVYNKAFQNNTAVNSYLEFINDHPEVSLFYQVEHKARHIIFLRNGEIEKYGFDDSPPVTDMEIKYGALPAMMKEIKQAVQSIYQQHWDEIAKTAQDKFHSQTPDVDAIIFPGDSRVIAVRKNRKPEVYDMDNAAPEERPQFEKLYGSLDGLVPPPSNFTNMFPNNILYKDWQLKDIQFIGFSNAVLEKEHSIFHLKGSIIIQMNDPSTAKGLIIYKGREYGAESFSQEFGKTNLHFAELTVYEQQAAFDHFGQKGQHGVVVVSDEAIKPPASRHDTDTVPLNISRRDTDTVIPHVVVRLANQKVPALYVIDGVKIPANVNLDKAIDPNDIISINVLKDSSAIGKYGEQARAGVVEIHTKSGHFRLPLLTDANATINAVFIVDGQQVSDLKKIHPEDIKSISVFKDSASLKKYGATGKDGVILITTVD